MPYGSWINDLPTGFFLTVHMVAFAIGAGFAWLAAKRTCAARSRVLALRGSRVVYMTYHLDWTVFLFAHTIAEVFDLVRVRARLRRAVYADRAPARRSRRPGDDRGSPPCRRGRRRARRSRRAAAARGSSAPVATIAVDDGRRAIASTRKRSRSRPATTVTWTNHDNFTHTVKVDGQADHKVGRGDSVSIRFAKAGTYHYVCTLHSQDMHGTVIVG